MRLLQQNEFEKLFDVIFSWSNPLLISIFIISIFVLIIYYINRYLIKPTEKKHLEEKKEIELRNSRLMALFAELDPDPVLRVDRNGEVNFYNDAANKILDLSNNNFNIQNSFNINLQDLRSKIEDNQSYSFSFQLNNVHFNVLLKGDSNLGIAQFYFRNITDIRDLQLKLKELSNYLQNQIDEERYRIATELHDGIVQELYLAQLRLRNYAESKDETQSQTFIQLNEQIENTTQELRRIIYDLKPKILDEMGLEPALKTLCNNVIKESGINGSIQFLGINKRLDKKLEIYFYRLVQESLSNIVKHSSATEFDITFFKVDNTLRAIISDNGKGFSSLDNKKDNKKGFGLVNMRERTESFGGKLKIDSSENNGVTIISEIPVNELNTYG